MLWLALYLPNLPLQVFQRGTPDGQPLAVTERRRLAAANGAAQRLGCRAGMGISSALALAPHLALRERDGRAEEAALKDVATWAGRYTPQVSLDPPAAVLLEVQASLRLFGGAKALLGDVASGCRSLGFGVQAAIAPTPRAARWLARAGRCEALLQGPAIEPALAALPIDVLDCEPEIAEMLVSIGALTLADCRRLPRAGLARRGAAELLQRLDQAAGRLPDPRPAFAPPARFASRIELPVPTDQTETLAFAAKRLLAGLCAWLDGRHAGIGRFALRLEHEDLEATRLHVALASPGRDEARFLLLCREHLARLALPAPATALALEADEPQPLPGRSSALFEDLEQDGEPVQRLLERLQARLGEAAVHGLACAADHRPERAWRACPAGAASGIAPPAGARPLLLLERAQPLETRGGRPWRGGMLRLLAGPERIECGWWEDGGPVARDYFVAEAPDKALLWIYREGGEWLVQGTFA